MLRRLIVIALLAAAPAAVEAQPRATPLSAGVTASLEAGTESPELRELRLAEEAMFRYGIPYPGREDTVPSAMTSDAPPAVPAIAEGGADLTWLQGATLPDLPMRWDDRVVQYLEYFRNDPRGHELMAAWLRRSTRYLAMIQQGLRESGLPEDLRCVALAESGFDPTARSNAGAVGMWQFVATTGEQYGLVQNHWVDERMDPYRATRAAASYFRDLQSRLGSWELSLAAYNMGYGALLRAVRKYNSNDYALLSRIEAGLPFETTIYVAKILACAVVMRNPERFGFAELTRDPPLRTATVEVPGATSLAEVARAASVSVADIIALNPHLRRRRTPPGVTSYAVHVPAASADTFARNWRHRREGRVEHRAYVVRFGERFDDVARRFGITTGALRELNELAEGEVVGPGTALLVPNTTPRAEPAATVRPVVAVPDTQFVYEGRRRVFYRIADGDRIADLARFFRVTVDELVRWNNLDPAARLTPGLLVQLYVPSAVDLDRAVVLTPDEVRVLVVGSEEFFDYHETQRGRVRVRYRTQTGDTLLSVAQRFGLQVADLSRINRMGRSTRLRVGQEIIVYTSRDIATRMEQAPLQAPDAATAREMAEAPADDAALEATPASETPAESAPDVDAAAETTAPRPPTP